ncbi:hypothetical protein ACFWDQ_30605 [Streptomyces sp. NPDC060053]|uniref:hypothetical protein n=1 Tax=Streptomyces sp. NPDC060053 TaxID=3347047 RepID=UPI0036AA2B6A
MPRSCQEPPKAAAGLFRGANRLALRGMGPSKERAAYFVHDGGGRSADGRTLPPALDVAYDPYDRGADAAARPGPGRGPTGARTVTRITPRGPPVTGRPTRDGVGRTADGAFWQYADSGSLPGDRNLFDGSATRLRGLAKDG